MCSAQHSSIQHADIPHPQHAQARAPMHVANHLPEHPGRISPISSFVAAAVGERRDGSTGSCLPCQYTPKCFYADCSPPPFPPTRLGLCFLQVAPLAFYPSFVLRALLFPVCCPICSSQKHHLPGREVTFWGALLPHPPLQRIGAGLHLSGGEIILLP